MNPITVATTLILMLATVAQLRATNYPSEGADINYSARIRSQIVLQKEEAAKIKTTTVRFYFTVDSSGYIKEVHAITKEPGLQQLLEDKFRRIRLNGYPANTPSNIAIHFILQ
jgi:hypothetical protein